MIKAKKSLGQNFLTDKNVLETIVNTAEITNKTILEIGPGTGNLTSFILKKNPKKVFVIEKDNDLAENLNNIFANQLTIINDDVLNIDKITNTVSIAGNEVLEVGPGTGNLTKEILKYNPSKMYLVEKDTFLAESLKEIID